MNNQDLIARLHETSQALEQLAQHLSEIKQTDNDSSDSAPQIESIESTESVDNAETETNAEIEIESENSDDSETDGFIIETTFEPIDEDTNVSSSNDTDAKVRQNTSAQAANQNNNNPFAKIVSNLLSKPLPNATNMGGFNPLQMLTGGLPGLSGGLPNLANLPGLGNLSGLNSQSLPTTLAELHDNPQLLGMLKSVSNNPQMLNMLSTLTGQDSQTLQQTLQSLQPTANAPAENITPNAAPSTPPAPSVSTAPTMQMPPAAQTSTTFAANELSNNLPPTPYLDSLLNEWHWQPYARAWDF